ncbi:MAG: SGNH/GDSL hydrolase family protein [Oscillospiraceae bacterium]|nr:SGNH/GDSL hydrolase family protein [Oscillospiraceae bacterium]
MKKVILFQGDSITDCSRNRDLDFNRGYGYATMVTGVLTAREPYTYTCYNRGISGERVVDVYARIRKDMINLKPDYISILVGVNGIWHECSEHNGVSNEKYETVYDLMLTEIKQELPNVKLMLLEPFVLHGTATEDVPECPNRWAYYQQEIVLRQQTVARLAKKHGAVFVPLQEMFTKLEAEAPAEGYWLRDGVHPTAAGHERIKQEWLKAFEKMK